MAQSEVKKIIRQLKKNEIRVFDVPEEYENDIQIVTFERKAGLRITGKRGFDIISNSFFVKEDLIHIDVDGEERKRSVFLSFDKFDSYFDFLNGDIYDNACYAFCPFSRISISKKIDPKNLMARKAFVEDTIDDYSLSLSNEEKENYEEGRQIHKYCQQWSKKFNNCSSYDELVKVVGNYKKSKIASMVDVSFFFFQYIFADVKDKQRFSIIMEYMSSGACASPSPPRPSPSAAPSCARPRARTSCSPSVSGWCGWGSTERSSSTPVTIYSPTWKEIGRGATIRTATRPIKRRKNAVKVRDDNENLH